MKKILAFLFLGLGVICIALAYVIYHGTPNGAAVDVIIPSGASNKQVSNILAEQKVILYPQVFKTLLRYTGGKQKVRAGEFKFQTGMSLADALNTLYYKEPVLHLVTFPEGLTFRNYAQMLAQQGLVQEEKFLQMVQDPKVVARYGFQSPTLEGFLFPDTYNFSKVDGEEKIIQQMVQRFKQKFQEPYTSEMIQKGWTLERLVTLASIVEKETGAAEERPIISSVFHNRLKKKMRLQSDPTTIYGIPNFNGNITKADLLKDTPYNTYTIPELPPGAIANPGLDSLVAALRPGDSPYLYFVSNNNGHHLFSETYSQHNQSVDTFQKKKKGRTPRNLTEKKSHAKKRH